VQVSRSSHVRFAIPTAGVAAIRVRLRRAPRARIVRVVLRSGTTTTTQDVRVPRPAR
jgi:hypothetical protein